MRVISIHSLALVPSHALGIGNAVIGSFESDREANNPSEIACDDIITIIKQMFYMINSVAVEGFTFAEVHIFAPFLS